MGLRVQLGRHLGQGHHVHPQGDGQKKRSPSYRRRLERHRAARIDPENAASTGQVRIELAGEAPNTVWSIVSDYLVSDHSVIGQYLICGL